MIWTNCRLDTARLRPPGVRAKLIIFLLAVLMAHEPPLKQQKRPLERERFEPKSWLAD
jgi:hypothetical protein